MLNVLKRIKRSAVNGKEHNQGRLASEQGKWPPGWPPLSIMKKLVLKKEHQRWVTVGSQHTNYSLENAMREVYQESGNRRFEIHDDKIYQLDD